MAFSLSGSTVTQWGIDTNLSGLSNITGVTTTTLGEIIIYDIPYDLLVTGDMSHAYYEQPVIGSYSTEYNGTVPMVVRGAGAIWRAGEEYNKFGTATYRRLPPIILRPAASNIYYRQGGIIDEGGTVDWKNVELVSSSNSFWVNNGNLKCRNVIVNRQNLNTGGVIDDAQMRFENGVNIDIDGFHVIGGKLFIMEANISQFKGYKPEQMTRAIGCSDHEQTILLSNGQSLLVGNLVEFEDFEGIGNDLDYGCWLNGYVRFINPATGTDLKVGGHNADNVSSDGWAEIRGTATVTTQLSDGTPVSDVKIVHQDNPTNANAPFDSRIDYIDTTISGQVNLDYLTGFVRMDDANNTSHSIVKRSATQSNDIYTLKAVSYLCDAADFSVDFKGKGNKEIKTTLVSDTSITETSDTGATALSYVTQENIHRLYDHLKALWVRDYDFSIETFPVTKEGNALNFGGLNVTQNGENTGEALLTASSVAFNAANFNGSIITTGTVTLINGATINGGITDANGIRVQITTKSGSPFNILARRTDTNSEFPFEENVTQATFQIPNGTSLQYALWQTGKQTTIATIDPAVQTAVTVDPLDHGTVDTSIDVSGILSGITVSLAPNDYSITFNTPQRLDIEAVKTTIHHILGDEASLRASLFSGPDSPSITIKEDEITINVPIVHLRRGSGLAVNQRVEITGFLNLDPALAINAGYIINPDDANNQHVTIPLVKPQLDPTQLAKAVWDNEKARLAIDHARAANTQTKT